MNKTDSDQKTKFNKVDALKIVVLGGVVSLVVGFVIIFAIIYNNNKQNQTYIKIQNNINEIFANELNVSDGTFSGYEYADDGIVVGVINKTSFNYIHLQIDNMKEGDFYNWILNYSTEESDYGVYDSAKYYLDESYTTNENHILKDNESFSWRYSVLENDEVKYVNKFQKEGNGKYSVSFRNKEGDSPSSWKMENSLDAKLGTLIYALLSNLTK